MKKKDLPIPSNLGEEISQPNNLFLVNKCSQYRTRYTISSCSMYKNREAKATAGNTKPTKGTKIEGR